MNVPTLDLSKFISGNDEERKAFSDDLGQSFNQTGFAIIKNHDLKKDLTDELYKVIKAFFDLEDEKKIKYYFPDLYGQRGYVVKGQEHAKGSKKGDLKEFFHIGNPSISNPQNIWPHEVESFNEIGSEVFITLENIGLTLLRAISMYLNLDINYYTICAWKK